MEEIVLNKSKIKINNQVVAILIGILLAFTTIIYTNAANNDEYNPSGIAVIDVGGSEMTLHIAYAGSAKGLKTSGGHDKKKTFKSKSRPIDVWAA